MILFISRNPPNPTGPGGSQRAMHLLQGVARRGPVDFLLLHREEDSESATDSLDAVRPLVRSCQRLEIAEWAPSWRRWPRLSWRTGQVAEAMTLGPIDAPRFSAKALAAVADLLPERRYDLVFAARLSSARIADDLIRRRLLAADRKIVDLDDRLSAFKRRNHAIRGAGEGGLRRILQRLEVRRLDRVERDMVRDWDAVGVASEVDAGGFKADTGHAVAVVPNAVERPMLPPSEGDGGRLLFVGHLGYEPNVHGLTRFLAKAWPQIQEAMPRCCLDVVGLRPDPGLAALIAGSGATLHADVPSVAPFYAACDVVIAPIWQGGGTRIKILEAMAYGRPVVSTTIGAEGLGIVSGDTGVLADSDADFAVAVTRLGEDPMARVRIAAAARQYQVARFGGMAVADAIDRLIDGTEWR